MARPLAHLDPRDPTPWPHPACLADKDILKQCRIGRGRAGGPGGQNRNKVETLVIITHLPSGLEAHAGERRSQGENKTVALRRL
ncbi:MAG: peptide chain release factor-like protein, partial [Phycisphaerae bacterium]|nr:peptide chain release factor-like protein [Phycisphaerae bacterium]